MRIHQFFVFCSVVVAFLPFQVGGFATQEGRNKRSAAAQKSLNPKPQAQSMPRSSVPVMNGLQSTPFQTPMNPSTFNQYPNAPQMQSLPMTNANFQAGMSNPAGASAAVPNAFPAAYPATAMNQQYPPTGLAYPPGSQPFTQPAGYSGAFPTGAYPLPQGRQQAMPNGMNAAQMPYGYNPQYSGYNRYQPMGYGGYNNGYYGQPGQGMARAAVPPLVTTPAPPQFSVAEYCAKPEGSRGEPVCKKNAYSMCDWQDNYPSDVATQFYGYYKAQITAMAADYDYANSDQYDTGFATQQNKLIDFVHDIFPDNEFGGLPGVPPRKQGLCEGESDTFQPGWARTAKGNYLVIMNSNTVKQSIRAEVCKNAGKPCSTVPKCYQSECRQRYRYDTLMSFDPCNPKRAPKYELFKIPDGCECFVIVDEPDLTNSVNSPNIEMQKRSPPKVSSSERSDDLSSSRSGSDVSQSTQELVSTNTDTPVTVSSTTQVPTTTSAAITLNAQ